MLAHVFEHIAITYLRDLRTPARFLDRLVKADVRHDRRHDGIPRERSLLHHVLGTHDEDVVAVDDLALLIHTQAAVSISVVRDADIRAIRKHHFLQRFKMR